MGRRIAGDCQGCLSAHSGRGCRAKTRSRAATKYGFAPNWSVGLEYDHLFMGRHDVTLTSNGALAPVGTFSRTDRIKQDVDLVTARINYGFGRPIIAKY